MTLHRYSNVHKEYVHAVELSRAVGASSLRYPPSGAHAKWATTKMRWATTSGWATKDGQRSEQVQNDRWHAFAPFNCTAAHYRHPVSARMLLWSCQQPCIPSRQAIAAHSPFQLFNSATLLRGKLTCRKLHLQHSPGQVSCPLDQASGVPAKSAKCSQLQIQVCTCRSSCAGSCQPPTH